MRLAHFGIGALVACRGLPACGAVSGPPPPSCEPGGPGLTDCGSEREVCCASLGVNGGTFFRTYVNEDGGPPANEADPATVSDFRLDKYLVTVGRFRRFVVAWNAGKGYLPPAGSGKHAHLNGGKGLENGQSPGRFEQGWVASDDEFVAPTDANLSCPSGTWTSSPQANETLPATCVNWYEAYAFCIWDGGFLPSEAEWVYAAAGGDQQREFPWGSTDPGSKGKYAIYYSPYDHDRTAPVGTAALGAGLWGQLDLAGEVEEWTLDGYSARYVNPCTDCSALTHVTARAAHGGYYAYDKSWLYPWYRVSGLDGERGPNFGFRCARSP